MHKMMSENSDREKIYKALSLKERMELALSETLPVDYRPFMLAEQWMQIRCYFARRADLSEDEIATLANDDDHVIRLCIAKRHDLTAAQVEQFVADRDPNIRHSIARSKLLTESQRQQLLNDSDPLVAQAATKQPRELRLRQRPGQTKLVK